MFSTTRLLRGARKLAPLFAVLTLGLASCARAADERPDEAAPDAPAPALNPKLPTLWIIGDSTVKNARPGYVGWGDPLADYFDATKINVANRALGGRSSRTYITEGLWAKVLKQVKTGDFVMMQFGHNDWGDPAKIYRASFEGNKDEAVSVVNPKTGVAEEVHTFGWYMRQYIGDTKAKGATPIVVSLVPHNIWKEGRVLRDWQKFSRYARIIARQNETAFIDLNSILANRYDDLGEAKVKTLFADARTHTNAEGAEIVAQAVVAGVKALPNVPLQTYLSAKAESVNDAAPRKKAVKAAAEPAAKAATE